MIPQRCYVGLGSNLGNPVQALREAVTAIGGLKGTTVRNTSSFWKTAPVGFAAQPDFINAACELDTTLSPHELLDGLLGIERRFGRERSFANAPRTLDLDLLLYGDTEMQDARLVLPHPRMHERAFVLAPLTEIAPDLDIPGRGRAAACLAVLKDQRIEKLED